MNTIHFHPFAHFQIIAILFILPINTVSSKGAENLQNTLEKSETSDFVRLDDFPTTAVVMYQNLYWLSTATLFRLDFENHRIMESTKQDPRAIYEPLPGKPREYRFVIQDLEGRPLPRVLVSLAYHANPHGVSDFFSETDKDGSWTFRLERNNNWNPVMSWARVGSGTRLFGNAWGRGFRFSYLKKRPSTERQYDFNTWYDQDHLAFGKYTIQIDPARIFRQGLLYDVYRYPVRMDKMMESLFPGKPMKKIGSRRYILEPDSTQASDVKINFVTRSFFEESKYGGMTDLGRPGMINIDPAQKKTPTSTYAATVEISRRNVKNLGPNLSPKKILGVTAQRTPDAELQVISQKDISDVKAYLEEIRRSFPDPDQREFLKLQY